ncbi:hypothetical protein [Streptosporangium sp. KLBMP 9127]|nr:hypothetical protein [Streptosporangium sp. KLBMP 9127]
MGAVRENQLAYQNHLLTTLREGLRPKEIVAVLLVDHKERPCLDVTDVASRSRRVYVHTSFQWFYWGDQLDERVSCLRPFAAVEAVAEAARLGWREGEQGELGIDISKIIQTYRSS